MREQMNARLRHEAKDPSDDGGQAWRARVFPGPPTPWLRDGELESLAAIDATI